MYLDSVGKGRAIDGISLSNNVAISCILFWVNDYRFLCNLSSGKKHGLETHGDKHIR